MNWKFWERGPKHDVEFIDTTRAVYQVHPIELAKPTRPFFYKDMMQEYGEYMFAKCPGMIDLKNYGYIIPAWDDIHIKANKAGVVAHVGGGSRPSRFAQARPMDGRVVKGVFTPEGGVPMQPIHVGSPWSIFVHNKNMSVALMPAFFHSPFLDDLYVFPGLVDYGKFTTMNFIFACKRPCELTIKVGTPLLQALPFESKHIKAGYGPADDYQVDMTKSIYSSSKQFYRKYIMHDKKSSIESIEESSK